MTDKELVQFAQEFRDGVLGEKPSRDMCAAVCLPLSSLLIHVASLPHKIMVGIVAGEKGSRTDYEHYWIEFRDGRILDPTADQFPWHKLPPVYLGKRLKFYSKGRKYTGIML